MTMLGESMGVHEHTDIEITFSQRDLVQVNTEINVSTTRLHGILANLIQTLNKTAHNACDAANKAEQGAQRMQGLEDDVQQLKKRCGKQDDELKKKDGKINELSKTMNAMQSQLKSMQEAIVELQKQKPIDENPLQANKILDDIKEIRTNQAVLDARVDERTRCHDVLKDHVTKLQDQSDNLYKVMEMKPAEVAETLKEEQTAAAASANQANEAEKTGEVLPSGYLSKLLRLGVEADDCVHESSVDTDPFMELGGQRRLTPDVGHQAALSNGSTSSMTWVRCSNENNQFGVAQGASYDSSYVQYYALAVYAPISKSVSFGVKPGTCHVQLFVDAIKTLDEGPTDNEARAVVNLNKGWHQILVKSFQKKIQQGDVREGFNIRIDRAKGLATPDKHPLQWRYSMPESPGATDPWAMDDKGLPTKYMHGLPMFGFLQQWAQLMKNAMAESKSLQKEWTDGNMDLRSQLRKLEATKLNQQLHKELSDELDKRLKLQGLAIEDLKSAKCDSSELGALRQALMQKAESSDVFQKIGPENLEPLQREINELRGQMAQIINQQQQQQQQSGAADASAANQQSSIPATPPATPGRSKAGGLQPDPRINNLQDRLSKMEKYATMLEERKADRAEMRSHLERLQGSGSLTPMPPKQYFQPTGHSEPADALAPASHYTRSPSSVSSLGPSPATALNPNSIGPSPLMMGPDDRLSPTPLKARPRQAYSPDAQNWGHSLGSLADPLANNRAASHHSTPNAHTNHTNQTPGKRKFRTVFTGHGPSLMDSGSGLRTNASVHPSISHYITDS